MSHSEQQTGESVTIQTEQGLYVNPQALTAHLPALDYRMVHCIWSR